MKGEEKQLGVCMWKTIDLCAGIGGIRRGFELAGCFKNVLSAEIDEQACQTYQLLYGDDPRNNLTSREFKDKVKMTKYDVLLAGFPCQTFSGVGLRQGFRDKTKGTIFFDVAEIIDETRPKVVFLENVRNLIPHDRGRTFKTIIDILENDLNYKVIGVSRKNGQLHYVPKSFVRNTKDFGLPQNRPRVYIVCFSRDYFGSIVDMLPNELPLHGTKQIFESVNDILESEVDASFFLSSGYLQTLESHAVRQEAKGYGFGYNIVNRDGVEKPTAMTLLATGGSGKERNLVIDKVNGARWRGKKIRYKKTPINSKNVRMMTPTEWGRLQGFIGYGFVDDNGVDHFRFPEGMKNASKFKQLGNSVSIPVIESMATFIMLCLRQMTNSMGELEKIALRLDPNSIRVYRGIEDRTKSRLNKPSRIHCAELLSKFGCDTTFSLAEAAMVTQITNAGIHCLLKQLCEVGCLRKVSHGRYSLSPLRESAPKLVFGPRFIDESVEVSAL